MKYIFKTDKKWDMECLICFYGYQLAQLNKINKQHYL